MIDIKKPLIIGRSKAAAKKYGEKGAIFIGNKYQEVDVYEEKLCNPTYLDVSSSHVISIFGKRGSGKSYTMGVIAEGFSMLDEKIRANISVVLVDTMGVYWTMKKPNNEQRILLSKYGLKPKGVDVKIFTPYMFFERYKKEGIPTDVPFSMRASELDSDDWLITFRQKKFSPVGVLINETITMLKETKKEFELKEVIKAIKSNEEFPHDERMEAVAMFELAQSWGIFKKDSPGFEALAKPGQISVLDLSCYATLPSGWDVKTMVLGIVAKHMFVQRMKDRKEEEIEAINALSLTKSKGKTENEMPLMWLVIDEAHEFLPKQEKDANAATEPLKIIMREGRQPGISLILATQQPGKIHTDVMTQSDVVFSHRVTADMDIKALMLLAQSYNRDGLMEAMEDLPRLKGTAIVFDDSNEAIHEIRIRPRFSWHGGGSPNAMEM